MISIKVFGKRVVEPKTLGIGITLRKKIQKWFRKPWSSCYFIEMFSNGFINKELDMGHEGVGGFLKKGIVNKCLPNQLPPCNHITLEWDGA
jgi:hypothetical protein